MTEFKDKIPAAGGKVEFLYQPDGSVGSRISGFNPRAMYIVAVSIDGKSLLGTVPAVGIGQTAVYPKPSIVAYIQSDDYMMWGRNCFVCQKYFRTSHVMGITCCPYCAAREDSLAFLSQNQRDYIRACYDAFARAMLYKQSTFVTQGEITDKDAAWHYDEEKLQHHFKCEQKDCGTQTDILGEYGYCPRCGHTNGRKVFLGRIASLQKRYDDTNENVQARSERGEVWGDITTKSVTELESLGKHLRRFLLNFPMTSRRQKELEELSFQQPLLADERLSQWFDVGLLDWPGTAAVKPRTITEAERLFIRKMLQRRHILIHSGGLVDDEYLQKSGDDDVRLGEKIEVGSNEAKRFLEDVTQMGTVLLDHFENRLPGANGHGE